MRRRLHVDLATLLPWVDGLAKLALRLLAQLLDRLVVLGPLEDEMAAVEMRVGEGVEAA